MEILDLEEKLLIDKTMKILADDERVERIRKKSDTFKHSNHYGWNAENGGGGFNQMRHIGALMAFIADYHPATKVEFAQMYFEHGAKGTCRTDKNGRLQRVSRTAKELKKLSFEFMERYNEINPDREPMTEDEAFEFVIIRIFYETFKGDKRETNTKIALNRYFRESFCEQYKVQNKANNVNAEPTILDKTYAIDCLVVNQNNSAVLGIQIKPETWVGLKPNPGCPEVAENYAKMSEFENNFSVKAILICAKENGEILSGLDKLTSYLHSIY